MYVYLQLKSTKFTLSSTFIDMKARDLPSITTTNRLVFELEEQEGDVAEKHKRQFDACVKQADEQIEKLLAEKKQLEQEIRRQSQQFRQVLEERDADVQVEYAKMLAEVRDHIEDTKQQLTEAIESRTAKQLQVKHCPPPSLANEADVHESHMLQQLVVAKSKEVTALQAQFHALEAELARPAAIKRKADALDGSHEYSAEAVAQEKKHLQDEIDMLMETDLALRDKATQSRLLAAQHEQNESMRREVAEVEQEAANVAASVAALSSRLQTQLRVLASSSSTGALLTRLYTFIVSHDKDTPIAMADVLAASVSVPKRRRAVH
ncbi:hypothetical protein AaE_004129 [Aphanomyces astaci]|uniref:Uncharacterized protein n=1 Tax=Aphanomyces astaci TaxID=112090 RepID=A0A6A5ABD8_APHAT|nr:hypothetical protein AaE_004129 [Aphanomyces astaci]